MAYKTKLLVVANQTVDSDELFAALKERADNGPVSVTLIAPQDHAGLGHRLNAALERLHEAGIEAEGMLGDVDPCVAVMEVWDPRNYDEVIVSTLPSGTSRWLAIDIPRRIQKVTDAPVQHIESNRVEQTVSV